MIIVDSSQLFHSSIHSLEYLKYSLNEENLRKVYVNYLKTIKLKFKNKGQMVLAIDSHSWRSKEFKPYKANRQKTRTESTIDYDLAFKLYEQIISEISDYFPYKVIRVHRAEADDIIYTLARDAREEVIIISRDKDFFQLHAKPNVKQWDPITEKMIQIERSTISKLLFTHICKGDTGDGIPNILSKSTHFLDPDSGRQKGISTKKLDEWFEMSEDAFKEAIGIKTWNRFTENRRLIDMSYMPDDISEAIKIEFNKPQTKKGTLYEFVIKNKLTSLLENLNELI